MKTSFDESWKDWIKTNVESGQSKDGIFKILLDEGYTIDAIVEEMGYRPSVSLETLVNPFKANAGQARQAQAINYGTSIPLGQVYIPNANSHDNGKLELYELDNFLNAEECGKIVELIRSELRPSELSSFEQDQYYRTSRTCDLGIINDPFMKDIDNRICRIIGIDQSYSEVIQGQHYDVGQEFKAHTDYFEAHEIDTHGGKMGQRTFTIMIYLNDCEEGGETEFTNVGVKLKPTTGMAVIWSSLNEDGSTNEHSMHQAHPVIKGYKAVITKWFRSHSNNATQPPMFTKEANEYVPNYTESGIFHTRLPEELYEKITAFYQANREDLKDEHIPGDFVYNNEDMTQVSSSLVPLTQSLAREIHDSMKPLMESWCGKQLDPTFVYGIRVYHDKAVLVAHRDRLETHIISVIINVDQEVREDWPLIIEDNYYRSHAIILKPGDMVFYEGARLAHGRPIAFNGKSFANIFCHFKPTDYVPKHLAQ